MDESLPPYPTGPGQRMLAAIVFTDVVSFSARMQDDEVTTLKLVDRDFTLMRKWCEKHSGSVLKTTGDGLLLHFSSAVHAVAFSLKMQRTFTGSAKNGPEEEALTHRVGVHLGDVFLTDKDVMGDGVNIAARLQSEADPGGICISQTVYDVVKNKMELDVVKLSGRKLKNISEEIIMYSLLLAPPRAHPAAGPGQSPRSFSPVEEPASFSLTPKQKMLAVVVLVAALGTGTWFAVQATRKYQETIRTSQVGRDQLDALLAAKTTTVDESPAKNISSATEPRPVAVISSATDYDFGALTLKRAGEKPPTTDPVIRASAAKRMEPLIPWLKKEIQGYTKDRPLLMRELGGAVARETKVFSDSEGRVYFAVGGGAARRDLEGLKPTVLGSVIVSALIAGQPPPNRDLVQSAEAFAYYYDLPEMIDALHNRSIRGDVK